MKRLRRKKSHLGMGSLQCNVSPFVAHGVAIIWCREDCDALPIVTHFVPIVLYLMASHDVVKTIAAEEPCRHI